MPDYMYMLESRLSAEQRAALLRVQELAAEAGSNVYLTGGAVRDLISGMPIRDLDFTVEGNPSRLARELEKGGARVTSEDDKLRHIELTFSGDVDGSIAAARDDVYARPGTRPEIRWATIMEDLHRRDFSLNAIAISLNSASRGLLLDPTNGLADLGNREVRGLTIHTFSNQPVRLLRAVRYAARMDFKLESRTAEWFALAIERQLLDSIPPGDIGQEFRQFAREDKPAPILKAWEAQGLIGTVHPQLVRRHPDYDSLARILRARDDLASAGLRARLFAPVTLAALRKLTPRERASTLSRLEYRAADVNAVTQIEEEAEKAVKILAGRKTAAPGDAFAFLEKTPGDILVFLMAEASNSKAVNKVRTYIHKWRPLQQALPGVMNELEAIGMPRGPKFDKVVADVFQMQLLGRARTPEDRVKILRKLSGIKEAPKKVEEKKKPDEKLKKKLMGQKGSAESAAAAPAADAAKTGKQVAASAGRAPAQTAASSAAPARGSHPAASSKGEGQKATAPSTGKKSRPESQSRSKPSAKAGTKSRAKS
jgi:tRNA nucleotidyltransferase (CCA-adding enzyme)